MLQVKKKDDSAAGEEEERTVSIISSLLLNIAKQVGLLGSHYLRALLTVCPPAC